MALRRHRCGSCGAESTIEIQDTIVGISIGCQEHGSVCDFLWRSEASLGYGIECYSASFWRQCWMAAHISRVTQQWCMKVFSEAEVVPSVICVSMYPGTKAFTRILDDPNSDASDRVRPTLINLRLTPSSTGSTIHTQHPGLRRRIGGGALSSLDGQ